MSLAAFLNLYCKRVCVRKVHHASWFQTSRRTKTPSQHSQDRRSFTLDLSAFHSVPWLLLHTNSFTVARFTSDFLRLRIPFGPAWLLWESDLRLGEGLKSDPRLGWETKYWAYLWSLLTDLLTFDCTFGNGSEYVETVSLKCLVLSTAMAWKFPGNDAVIRVLVGFYRIQVRRNFINEVWR